MGKALLSVPSLSAFPQILPGWAQRHASGLLTSIDITVYSCFAPLHGAGLSSSSMTKYNSQGAKKKKAKQN